MSNKTLDDLNSACCRIRGTIMTVEGIQKGSFPTLDIDQKICVDSRSEDVGSYVETITVRQLAERLEPLLKVLLPSMLQELRELREEAATR